MSVVALLLISIVGTGVAVSQQAQKGNAKAMAAGVVAEGMSQNAAMNVPIRAIHSGHGFALADDGGFHVLRVNILKVGQIHPGEIRGLMGENKSISEIRAEIENMTGGAPFYRGHMRLGEEHYRLVNMSVAETDDGNRTFEADVVGPIWSTKPSDEMNNTGHINVTVMPYEGTWIGDGTLNMYEGDDYSGEYRVLLDVLPPQPRPWRQ
ncbi:MAG: hypothetical protein JJE19_04475 [Methanosarcinales archaeon]|nr:hypothetical protein [Methanosarcinales archaeon]